MTKLKPTETDVYSERFRTFPNDSERIGVNFGYTLHTHRNIFFLFFFIFLVVCSVFWWWAWKLRAKDVSAEKMSLAQFIGRNILTYIFPHASSRPYSVFYIHTCLFVDIFYCTCDLHINISSYFVCGFVSKKKKIIIQKNNKTPIFQTPLYTSTHIIPICVWLRVCECVYMCICAYERSNFPLAFKIHIKHILGPAAFIA